MINTTDYLTGIRCVMKLHESMLKEICEQYHLTLIEANIISFLHNNPGKDTAGDIVELRMLSKGNVSQAVEKLIQKSLIRRTADKDDRRRIHLSLLPAAVPITDAIQLIMNQLHEELCEGLSIQEQNQLETLTKQLTENVLSTIKRRERNEE